MSSPLTSLDEHNREQRNYFERTLKRTMLPANTPYLHHHVTEMIRFAHLTPADRVLEVGCGMGRYTLILAERGIQIEGLDLSPVLIDRLREFDGGRFNLSLHADDILNFSRQGESFDAVIGFFTLHHLHALDESLRAMTRLLKPNGRLAFIEPNPYNPLYYFQITFTPGMSWRGERRFFEMRASLLLRAFARAGLTRIQMARFGFFPPFLANRAWANPLEKALESFVPWRPLLPFQIFSGERTETNM